VDFPGLGGGPDKPAFLQTFAEQTRTLAVPPDDLEQSTPPPSKDKQMARIRIFSQYLLGLRRQRIKPALYVGHACRNTRSDLSESHHHADEAFSEDDLKENPILAILQMDRKVVTALNDNRLDPKAALTDRVCVSINRFEPAC
jgi:hypothetical protein